jgi:hypothetical protein
MTTAARTGNKSFTIVRGKRIGPQKIIVYGTGGIGKSELCKLLAEAGRNPLFLDVDGGTSFQDIARIEAKELTTFSDVRSAIGNPEYRAEFDTYVIDTVTKVEELAGHHVVANYKAKGDKRVDNLEGFGFGDGYIFRHYEMLNFLGDCDSLVRAGISVVMIAHDTVARVPNPDSTDYIRWEPRIYKPKDGESKAQTRAIFKEWTDHLLFINYDVHVNDEGKAKGGGSRTIYTSEAPTYMAKSRSLTRDVPYTQGSALVWNNIFNGEQ